MEEAVFDYVVIGAGSAGCVLANRLTENSSVTVALVEAGGEARNPLLHIPGALLLARELRGATWRTPAEPAPGSGMAPAVYVRGRVLGGTSAINGLLHLRGLSADFDHWAQLGNRGWSAAEVMPLYARSESWLGAPDPRRGRDGPQPVSPLPERPPLCEMARAAAERLGLRYAEDINTLDGEGCAYYQQSRRGRWRVGAAGGHLAQARRRPNLALFARRLCTAISIEDGRATGAVLDGGGLRLRARREVILCAGAIGTPHLLMLSGIGDAPALAAHGIAPRHHLPGVGADFQDHFVTRLAWRVPAHLSINRRAHGWRLLFEAARWLRDGGGLPGFSAALFGLFLRSRPELDQPDLQFVLVPASFRRGRLARTLDRAPGLTIGCWVLRPESRGRVLLRSADPREEPRLLPNPLAAEADQRSLVAGLRFARRLVATPPLAGLCGPELPPGAAADDDAALLEHARRTGGSVGHYAGTCRMGRDAGAVVDERLRVRGLAALRIADASVMPRIVSANTHATAMMIGEKAAELIRAGG